MSELDNSALFDLPETPEPRLAVARKRFHATMLQVEDCQDGGLGVPFKLHNELYLARIELAAAEREELDRRR